MSLQFSDTLTKQGLIQFSETTLFGDDGYGQISGNENRLFQFTGLLNNALDRFTYLALSADGRWKSGDSNYTGSNEYTTNIVSGQREYLLDTTFIEIQKVLVKDSNGTWQVITPFDQHDYDVNTYLENNTGNTGVPTRYDKTGSSIIFDRVPNYSASDAIKVIVSRGPYHFEYTDNTRTPGIPSIFHPYIYRHACMEYAANKSLPIAKSLQGLVIQDEQAIIRHFGRRGRDEKKRLVGALSSNK